MPDPATGGDCGVQLMTIHKSKGLEFEVVIVPDLQAQSGRGSVELLSWLERGLAEPGEDGELTEFLIAPVQYKGADPGAAKRWVDRARRDREIAGDAPHSIRRRYPRPRRTALLRAACLQNRSDDGPQTLAGALQLPPRYRVARP